jgi:xylulokinase
MTLNHSGGLLLRWFRDTLCRDKCKLAAETSEDAYDLILAGASNGPTTLMVLPHFSGAGTPLLDTTSKGVILGMTFATTQADIAKAILEGLTFELRVNIDLLRNSGITIDEFHAVGGGAQSDLWLQLKADICRTPLCVPKVTEAACLGAAILASVAAEIYPDLPSAVKQAVQQKKRIEPDRQNSADYEKRYNIYRKLYTQLISLLRQC